MNVIDNDEWSGLSVSAGGDLNGDLLDRKSVGEAEEIRWKSSADGLEILVGYRHDDAFGVRRVIRRVGAVNGNQQYGDGDQAGVFVRYHVVGARSGIQIPET